MEMKENGLEMIGVENTTSSRTADVIAAEINIIKAETGEIIKRSIFEIGKRLCEAKEIVGFGNWAAWLEENVNYSESTAQNLMRAFREYGDEQINMITGDSPADYFEKLNLSQMVALFPLPAGERRAFAEENNIEEKSVREIERLVREKKAAEEALKNAVEEAEALKNSFVGQIQAVRDAAVRDAAEEARNALAARLDEEAGERKKLEDTVEKKKKDIKDLKNVMEGVKAQLKESEEECKQLRADLDAAVRPEMSDEEREAIEEKLRGEYAIKADPDVQGITFNIGDISERVQKIEEALIRIAEKNQEVADSLRTKVLASMKMIVDGVHWRLN